MIAVLVAVTGVFALNYRHQHPQTGTTTVIPVKVPNSSAANTSPSNVTSTQPPQTTSAKASGTSSNSTLPLIAPSGTFVSNHWPSLSGTSAPSTEQSICITSPGAQCYIEFTKNGITKKLDSLTADSNGNVYWSWDVKQAGFTQGSWTIRATASLNGQTKATSDSLTFEVQP